MSNIVYPYLPEGRTILYVPADNPFMQAAKSTAKDFSLDPKQKLGAVIVNGSGVMIGFGANGSAYHETNPCARKGYPSGQGYELCEGCHPKNHGEAKAIADALDTVNTVDGCDLYLWGHWWCCKDCWAAMDAAGIRNVYLMEGSEVLFNPLVPGNIIGRQFED